MRNYALACDAFRLKVETDDNDVITRAHRQAQNFVGQPLNNLTKWMAKFANFSCRRLPEQDGLTFDAAAESDTADAG